MTPWASPRKCLPPICQCRHCLAANVGTSWKAANRPARHSKIVDVAANWYGPAPVLMLATARNARSPMVKNSASSPPGAGSVAQGSRRPPARFSSSRSVSLSPPFIPGDPPGMSLASCGTARSSWPPTWTSSTARAPLVGYRCTSVRVTCIASLQQPCWCQTSNLELLSTTCSVNGCDVSVLDVRKLIMLEAVMAEGSIAAAARRLQYTRSAVSQQISALEAEAGTPLVDRAGNHITLTPAGRSHAGRRGDADHRAAAGGHPVPRGPAHHEHGADGGAPALPRHGDPA